MKQLGILVAAAALLACGDVVPISVDDTCDEGFRDCDGECLSVVSDEANCGDCGVTCSADQACIDSICEDFSSFISAEFETTPADTTGWVTSDGSPIRFSFIPVEFDEGVIYECRTGPRSMIGSIPFGPCDGADGAEPIHEPAPNPAAEEGSYITEMRVVAGDFTSEPAVFEFYAHRSLDSVAVCQHSLTDAEIFAAAGPELLRTNPPAFNAGIQTRNPFVALPFTNVQPSARARQGQPWNQVAGGNFTVQADSLRRRFAVSANNQLLLVQRRYVSRRAAAIGDDANICRNGISLDNSFADCENFVLNAQGASVCVRDLNGEVAVDSVSSNGFIKLTKRMFSPKGSTEQCIGDFNIGACEFYLFLPE